MKSLLRTIAHNLRRPAKLLSKPLKIAYAWIPYHLYQDGKAWRPLFVTLELTYLCNLRCRMCSLVEGKMVTKSGQRENPELLESDGTLRRELSTSDYLELIRQMGEAGVRGVTVTGGEPTLRRDIHTLIEALKTYPIKVALISNGTGKPEVYTDLIRLGLDSITISVDGTRDTHDHVRGLKGSFDRAMLAILTILGERMAQGLDRPTLEVSCAISALNQDDIENLVRWFGDSGVDALKFGYLHFSTSARQRATEQEVDGPLRHLKNHELEDAVVRVDTKALAARVARIKAGRARYPLPVRFQPDLSPEEIQKQYTDGGFPFASKCFHPWLATRVDPWGQMYPCWIDLRLGDVREQGFLNLWNSQLYKQFRQTIRRKKLLPKCATCPALTDKHWSHVPTLNRGLSRARCH
jgi:MoaA/NifB/PqqE/SkfB family radical SAM enzyme